MSEHSWETASGSEDFGNEDGDDWEVDSDGSDPGPAADNEEAPARSYGQQLVDYCQVLLLTRTLNAKHFCIIMWLAALAGIAEAKPYGLKPDVQSGKYLRLLKNKLGYLSDKSALYQLNTPGRRKDTLGRTTNTMHVPPSYYLFVYTWKHFVYIHIHINNIYIQHTHQQYIYIQHTYIYIYICAPLTPSLSLSLCLSLCLSSSVSLSLSLYI